MGAYNLDTMNAAILAFANKIKQLNESAGSADFAANAGKVGGLTVAELHVLIAGEAGLKTTVVRQMIEDFIARRDNPNQVTKDQVELGNLMNYGMANKEQAQNTVTPRADLYMSPATVKDAFDALWAVKVGLAPDTLDTIEELAEFVANNRDFIEALNTTVANKATKVELATAVASLNESLENIYASVAETKNGLINNKSVSPVGLKAVRDDMTAETQNALNAIGAAFENATLVLED